MKFGFKTSPTIECRVDETKSGNGITPRTKRFGLNLSAEASKRLTSLILSGVIVFGLSYAVLCKWWHFQSTRKVATVAAQKQAQTTSMRSGRWKIALYPFTRTPFHGSSLHMNIVVSSNEMVKGEIHDYLLDYVVRDPLAPPERYLSKYQVEGQVSGRNVQLVVKQNHSPAFSSLRTAKPLHVGTLQGLLSVDGCTLDGAWTSGKCYWPQENKTRLPVQLTARLLGKQGASTSD